MLKLALKNLARRKTRTILTILGITIAISFTVGLLSISEGFIRSFDQSLQGRGEDIFVSPKETGGYPSMLESYGAKFPEEYIAKIEKINNVKAVYPIYSQTLYFIESTAGPVEKKSSIMENFIGLNGITPSFLKDLRPNIKLKEGRALKEDDKYKIVVASQTAESQELDVGDIFKIRQQDFEVVGVLESQGSFDDMLIYAPLKTLQKLYGEEGKLTLAAVTVKDLDKAEETTKAITSAFPDISARTMEEISGMMKDLLSTARAIHLSISSIALLIGVLFVISTMLMAVSERTKEIGTMRAIGVHRSQIFELIIFESLIISLIAGLLGLFGGYILSKGITYVLAEVVDIKFFTPLVSARILGFGISISLLIGGFAGIFPASRISKINITDALHHE